MPGTPILLREVRVRPVRPEEELQWNTLLCAHHYLGFRKLCGAQLKEVAVWGDRWLALLGRSETKQPLQRLLRGLEAQPPPPNRDSRCWSLSWRPSRGSAAGAFGPRWQAVDSGLEECSGEPEPR